MSFYIYDVYGYIADGPSILGMKELREKVLIPHGGPVTQQFVREGTTEDVEGFVQELRKIEPPEEEAIATSLEDLLSAVELCEDVVILTTGVLEEEPDDALVEDKEYLV